MYWLFMEIITYIVKRRKYLVNTKAFTIFYVQKWSDCYQINRQKQNVTHFIKMLLDTRQTF